MSHTKMLCCLHVNRLCWRDIGQWFTILACVSLLWHFLHYQLSSYPTTIDWYCQYRLVLAIRVPDKLFYHEFINFNREIINNTLPLVCGFLFSQQVEESILDDKYICIRTTSQRLFVSFILFIEQTISLCIPILSSMLNFHNTLGKSSKTHHTYHIYIYTYNYYKYTITLCMAFESVLKSHSELAYLCV